MIKPIAENIFQLTFREFGSFVYLLKKEKILIDASSKVNKKELLDDLKQLDIKPEDIKIILLTHGHYDHIENIDAFPNAEVYVSMKDIEYFNLKNVQPLSKFSYPDIEIIETPGHTKGSVCFFLPKQGILFSGDTIFDTQFMAIGRTDFPESRPEQMSKSLEKLKKLKYKILCPGH